MEKIFKRLETADTMFASFKLGVKSGLNAAAPVLFAGMVGFGAMGHSAGLSIFQTAAISVLMYALPGQIVFLEMMAMGVSYTSIAFAVALTSTRFLTMVLTLFPQIPKAHKEPPRMVAVHLVAMSSWAYCMNDFPKMKPEVRYGYFLGIGLICWLISFPGTVVGYLVSQYVPIWITLALLFVNPLFFLLSFLDVKAPLNQMAILVGLIVGAIFYVIDPAHALMISGLGFGSLVYFVDLLRRRRMIA
jgi:predicted branched-subunit amino acid permease